MNQCGASLIFPVFGWISQADAYPRYTRRHSTSFTEKLCWEFSREGVPTGDDCGASWPQLGWKCCGNSRSPMLVQLTLPGDAASGVSSSRWTHGHGRGRLAHQQILRWTNIHTRSPEIYVEKLWISTLKEVNHEGWMFPHPPTCHFTRYEFYENRVEWNGDLPKTLKPLLMEQATPERSLCLNWFQSARSQSPCDAGPGQQNKKAEPIPQQQLKKMGKDISASNPVRPEL